MEQIRPHIIESCSGISGLFTLKNSSSVNREGVIPGWNFGLNTTAGKQEVDHNYSTLLGSLSLAPDSLAIARQVHGSQVNEVHRGGVYPDTDALLTDTPGLALGIQVADCAAVLIADPVRRVVAAVHAGWRGALDEIVPKTVERMASGYRSQPEDLRVYISPAICQKFFEVGEEVSSRFPPRFVDNHFGRKPHVDLKGFIVSQLAGAGVKEGHVQVDQGCTWLDRDRFYSYRREGDQAGRMLAMVWLYS
ncbi:MAG: peptidoglycan editing factor PgeF [Balneolaceae bacterium]